LGTHAHWFDYSKHHQFVKDAKPFDGAWNTTDMMLAERTDATVTLLGDGRRFVMAGGMGPDLNKGLSSMHLFSFNASSAGINTTEPADQEVFYGQNTVPVRTKVVPLSTDEQAELVIQRVTSVKSSAAGLPARIRKDDDLAPSAVAKQPIADPGAAARKAAMAAIKKEDGVVDVVDEPSWEDDSGEQVNRAQPAHDASGSFQTESGEDPVDDCDLDALVSNPTAFSSINQSQQPRFQNNSKLINEADDLINSVLGQVSPRQSMLSNSNSYNPSMMTNPMMMNPMMMTNPMMSPRSLASPTGGAEDKVVRARQGLQNAVSEVQQQIRNASMQTSMVVSQDMIPILLNQSKTLKVVKSELLNASNFLSLQDYQIIPNPVPDKLQFAKNYLQQEINGLEGMLNSIFHQISQLTILQNLVSLIQVMMNVKNIMKNF